MSTFAISATAHSLLIGKFQSNIWLHFYDWFNLGFPHFYITFYHYLTFLPLLSSSPENPGFLFFFYFILNPILRTRFSFKVICLLLWRHTACSFILQIWDHKMDAYRWWSYKGLRGPLGTLSHLIYYDVTNSMFLHFSSCTSTNCNLFYLRFLGSPSKLTYVKSCYSCCYCCCYWCCFRPTTTAAPAYNAALSCYYADSLLFLPQMSHS